ncbi:MAG: hypothetical protein H6818_08580 [Phycisphaerales bacterium]|nr:hypothetical protein [Phycisphaerales bacterium]MCB9862626.1 hypothetical protein [Phycisphaerales bacterium]
MGATIGQLKLLALSTFILSAGFVHIPLGSGDGDSRAVSTAPAGDIKPLKLPEEPEKKDADDNSSDTVKKAQEAIGKLTDSDSSGAAPATKPADSEPKTESAQLEVYVPSVIALARAFEDSKTSELVEAVGNLIPEADEITGDDHFDVAALAKLSEHLLNWPDTSLTFTTFAQDRDGRPRWALRVDWPLPAVVDRVRTLLADDSAKKILENVRLVESDHNAWRLELPDMVLAYLREADDGTMLTSTDNLVPPTKVYGVEETADKKGRYRDSRLFCRLNLDSEDEGARNAMFSALVGVSSIDYELRLLKNGNWREMFVVKWNAMIGLAAKAIFQKTKSKFECPNDAFVTAVLNLGTLTKGAPDGITGLPPGTIGSRTTGEMAFSLIPGTGFLPFPDTYYQFRTGPRHLMVHKIRDAINADAKKRREDDRRPAWFEENIDGQIVFWKDPTADGSYGLAPATYRTVIFFEPPLTDEEMNHKVEDGDSDEEDAEEDAAEDTQPRMVVIANTSTWADDAVRNFRNQIKDATTLPSTKKMDWQARINWARTYQLAYPYIALATGMSEDAGLPPEPKEVDNLLSDSRVDVKISVGGFLARHVGPVPVGGLYVPTVAALTLNASADPGSEIAREQTACRRLRVLFHHCKLFKKDYGRWPATVAELDGYVDFASHPYLLQLREKKVGLLSSFASAFSIDEASKTNDQEASDDAIDDTLYEIDWSDNDADWRLKLRKGEFVAYDTIYIDAEGEIHRVPKSDEKTARISRDDRSGDTESPKL